MYHKYIKNWFSRGNKKLVVFHGMSSSKDCIVCSIVNGLMSKKPIYVATSSSMIRNIKSKVSKKVKIMTHSEILKRKVPTNAIIIVDGIIATLKHKKIEKLLSHKDRKVILMDRNHKLLRASHRNRALRLLGDELKRVLYVKKIEPKSFKKVVHKKVKAVDLKDCIDKIKKTKGKSVVCVEKVKEFLKKMNEKGYKKYGSKKRGRKYALMDKKGIDAFNKDKVKLMVVGKDMKDKELKNVDNIHVIGSKVNKDVPIDRADRFKRHKRKRNLNVIDYKRKRARRSSTRKPVDKPKTNKPVNKPKPNKPVNKPKPNKPVNKPKPNKPVNKPDTNKPVNKPKTKKPINKPKPNKPVNKPETNKPVNKPKPNKPVNKPKTKQTKERQVIVKGKKSKKLNKLLDRIQNIPGGPKIEIVQ